MGRVPEILDEKAWQKAVFKREYTIFRCKLSARGITLEGYLDTIATNLKFPLISTIDPFSRMAEHNREQLGEDLNMGVVCAKIGILFDEIYSGIHISSLGVPGMNSNLLISLGIDAASRGNYSSHAANMAGTVSRFIPELRIEPNP